LGLEKGVKEKKVDEGKEWGGSNLIQNVGPNYVPTIYALAISLAQKW
jgi:hypothetical protein